VSIRAPPAAEAAKPAPADNVVATLMIPEIIDFVIFNFLLMSRSPVTANGKSKFSNYRKATSIIFENLFEWILLKLYAKFDLETPAGLHLPVPPRATI
jgi:hypothetical protein